MAIIAVDTNVVVRLLAKDDAKQFQRSFKLFQEKEIFICNTVILETEWVLRFAYKFSPSEIYLAFNRLFGLPNIHLNDVNLVTEVLRWYHAGLDFADAFHLAQTQQCSQLYSFDKKFLRQAKGLSKCELMQP